MPPAENRLLQTARPVLEVNGQEQASFTEMLLEMLIVENVQGLYRCELKLSNWGVSGEGTGFQFLDRSKIDFGHGLKIKPQGDETIIFNGRVMGFEAEYPQGQSPAIVLLAEDRLQDLRMTRRTRSFEDTSDADLFRQVARDHSLRDDIQLEGPTHRALAQVNQSDLAFLRERARLLEVELWLEEDTLHACPRSARGAETVRLSYGGSLHSFTVQADLAAQRTSVKAHGWDVGAKQTVSHAADKSPVSNELDGNKSGADILEEKIGARIESLVHTVPFSQEEARTYAEGYFRTMARRFVTGTGTTNFDPKLRVGNLVEIEALGPMFSGKYYICEVRHTFDQASGFRTQFSVERPFISE
ncbi:MAG: hypothetical protein CVU44_15080 [Chloroflexi bacterium HGW-Chloroflexi-6]|nr:MAG: hypothetical protein CVU44_15080 [Chloroflexi bacterium HGW-Chloroflexi-6]